MNRQPRTWETSADLPRDEPGLRIRDSAGDEATSRGDVQWKWDLIDSEPTDLRFNTDKWQNQPEFPVTEILPDSTFGGGS